MAEVIKLETFLQTDIDEPNQPKIKDKLAEFKSQIEGNGEFFEWDEEPSFRIKKTTKSTINNPLSGFFREDAFKIFTTIPSYYIRFGALLEFILDNVIVKIKNTNNDPIFNIDVDRWNTHMYSLPNQISLDPRVCLVRNDKFNTVEKGITNVFGDGEKLQPFKEVDAPAPTKGVVSTNDNAAYPLNIYLNFDFVLECLKSDEKGNVSVYELISNICTGLNKALGGINNLEPIIDENSNTLRIIDTTPIPEYSSKEGGGKYILQIYGYDKIVNDYISNFVRKVDLKTAITPEFATMITVGATAGGYIKGVEATAFSKWNTGLVDRFKEEFLPTPNTEIESKNEAAENYTEIFLLPPNYKTRFGFTDLNAGKMKFADNIIEKNISTVTEYYKWLIAENTKGKPTSGGSVGFIPFKLGLTLDGISGIKIYNVLRVNTEFLPKAYGKTVNLIITGVSHILNNNDWETSIEATVMPKTGEMALVTVTAEQAATTLSNATGKKIGGQVKRATEKYGPPPQEGGKIPLETFWTSYPIFYSGIPIKNLQNATQKSTKKSIQVKLSNLTWDRTNKHWTDPNGTYGASTDTYKTSKDKLITTFKVHKNEKSSIEKCYIDIKKSYSLEKIYELGFNTCGGTFVARNTRNGSSYSMHSWGIAIDMCAALNPNTTTPNASFAKPECKEFISIMESNGWYSGGKAWGRDWMHFQTIKP